MTTLSNLAVNDKVKIVGFKQDNPAYRKKLLAMGLTKGAEFTVTRKAPLGDPIEISIRGSALILRKKEAEILEVEKI